MPPPPRPPLRSREGTRGRARATVAALVLALLIGGGLTLLGARGGPGPRLPASWQRGMNLTSFKATSFGSVMSDNALTALRATGANSVAIVVYWYMASRTASEVAPDALQTPTDAAVLHAMRTARSLGLRVMLKPQVDVRDGSFRGNIAPADVITWFASYTAMIDHYAQLAAQGGAEMLVVGDELSSMAAHASAFRTLIAGVRGRFHGALTFAANWVQGAEQVSFWSSLDLIGVDAYMPLTPGVADPSFSALLKAWRPWQARLEALHTRYRRPVLFTELGYPSRLGAAASPSSEGSARIDQAAQARAYDAAYQTWSPVPWFHGIYWWDWSADGDNERVGDGSYRPAGKLAETVMRYWNDVGPVGSERRLIGAIR